MRDVTVLNYCDDPLYPRVTRAVEEILRRGKVVAPVDVLVRMQLLAPKDLDAWRRGRVSYLERVVHCNLTRLSRILRLLRFHAHDLRLVPSITVYMRWGKGPKQRLRFTKTGDPRVEEAYARHFVWPGKGPFPASRLCRSAVDADRATRGSSAVPDRRTDLPQTVIVSCAGNCQNQRSAGRLAQVLEEDVQVA